jgi:hypothetical protein
MSVVLGLPAAAACGTLLTQLQPGATGSLLASTLPAHASASSASGHQGEPDSDSVWSGALFDTPSYLWPVGDADVAVVVG